jgi:hypothetical protein
LSQSITRTENLQTGKRSKFGSGDIGSASNQVPDDDAACFQRDSRGSALIAVPPLDHKGINLEATPAVSITPEFERKLLAEIDHNDLRAELRAALQSADHTRAKKSRRYIRPVEPTAERWEEYNSSLIAKAARKAGTNCE